MKAIPNSKAKKYGTPGYIPTRKGLERYWEKIVGPTLLEKQIERIILVDHSGSGQSVDGFRRSLLDACQIGVEKSHGAANGLKARQQLSEFPMYLVNVIDASRADRSRPVIDPKTVPVLAKLTTGGRNLVNVMVGGERHPRVQPEYPPTKWDIAAKDCASAQEKADAKAMRDDIINWNKNHGGLIGSPVAPSSNKKTKKPLPKGLKKLMLWTLT
jgi:hypothetical protein